MIKVAFLLNYPTSYRGALNYFQNLFFAIDKYLDKEVELFLFVPENLSQEFINIYEPYAKIIKTEILNRNGSRWIIDKVFEKLFNVNPLLDRLLLKYGIDIVSHSSYISNKIKTINWIMDFQHIHFSSLWTKAELRATRRFLNRLIVKSDGLFLSSYSAFEDFRLEYETLSFKVNVLHFVCQPKDDLTTELTKEQRDHLCLIYSIDRPFFYLPNQFWSHKNHKVVFEAIKLMKDEGFNPLLITSGLMDDFRSKKGHIKDLRDYVEVNCLENNIKFLGLIPYTDVLSLITVGACIINPSLFEGWSSTVEESKTMGKQIILSDIKVHHEQDPEFGIYFNPSNAKELASLMMSVMKKEVSVDKINLEDLNKNLSKRTESFAMDYWLGVKKVLYQQ